MLASSLCLLHCLGMPLLMVASPILGTGSQEDGLHRLLAVVVTILAAMALLPGFVVHRQWRILALGVSGWLGFLCATLFIGPRFGESAEMSASVAGGLLLFAAHAGNRHCCAKCPPGSPAGKSFRS